MQLQYDVRAEIVDYVPRILRLPCKQEDDVMTTKETAAATTTKQAAARQRAFAQLDATFRSGVTRPLRRRKAQLDAMARMLRQNATVIARAVRADLGRPAAETALMEIGLVLDEIRCRSHASAGGRRGIPSRCITCCSPQSAGQSPSRKAWRSSSRRGTIRCCSVSSLWRTRSPQAIACA